MLLPLPRTSLPTLLLNSHQNLGITPVTLPGRALPHGAEAARQRCHTPHAHTPSLLHLPSQPHCVGSGGQRRSDVRVSGSQDFFTSSFSIGAKEHTHSLPRNLSTLTQLGGFISGRERGVACTNGTKESQKVRDSFLNVW